ELSQASAPHWLAPTTATIRVQFARREQPAPPTGMLPEAVVHVTFHGTIERGQIIMYRRIGILSFSSPGHYYPLTALGRRLQSRGHDVVYFQVVDLEEPIRAAGLHFHQIGAHDFPLGSLRARDEEVGKLEGLAALRSGIRVIVMKSQMLFRDAPAAIRD